MRWLGLFRALVCVQEACCGLSLISGKRTGREEGALKRLRDRCTTYSKGRGKKISFFDIQQIVFCEVDAPKISQGLWGLRVGLCHFKRRFSFVGHATTHATKSRAVQHGVPVRFFFYRRPVFGKLLCWWCVSFGLLFSTSSPGLFGAASSSIFVSLTLCKTASPQLTPLIPWWKMLLWLMGFGSEAPSRPGRWSPPCR